MLVSQGKSSYYFLLCWGEESENVTENILLEEGEKRMVLTSLLDKQIVINKGLIIRGDKITTFVGTDL